MKFAYFNKKFGLLLALMLLNLFLTPLLHAQTAINVKGLVTDEQNLPIAGATITLKNIQTATLLRTQTDNNGIFNFKLAKAGQYSFSISFVGFQSQTLAGYTLKAGETTTLTVKLKEESNTLNDVVVVGYGSQQKRFLTGSQSNLKGEQLNNYAASSFAQQLAGKTAGVAINDVSAQPGEDPKVVIRGIGTLTAGTDPLIVVDGFPLSEGSSLNSINPSDIESMDILKDPASAAIYGSRAANGVIIITTKKGNSDKVKVAVNAYTGLQQRADNVTYVDAYEAAKFLTLARDNGYVTKNPANRSASDDNATRKTKGASAREMRLNYIQPYLDGQPGLTNTNWLDEILRTAPMNNVVLSISGAKNKTNFYTSFGYFEQEGLLVNNGLKRYSGNFKLNTQLSDKIDFGFVLNPTFTQQRFYNNNSSFDDPFGAAAAMYPFFAPYNADGSLAISQQIIANTPEDGSLIENPIATMKLVKNNRSSGRIFGNTYFTYKPIKHLTYKLVAGSDFSTRFFDFYDPTTVGEYRTKVSSKIASASETNIRTFNYIFEHTLTYAQKLGKHDINLVGGYTFQRENYASTAVRGTNIADDNIDNIAGAGSFNATPRRYSWAQISYFARLQYILNEKYIASLTYRTDGSSRFGNNNKWGSFPSVTTGWIFTKESFFPKNKAVTFGKLRATWGMAGNNQIGNYDAFSLVTGGAGNNYVFGGTLAPGYAASTTPNPNLSWETKTSYNLGLDLELWKQISLTAEYYNTRTKDLLLDVPIPYQSGFTSSTQNIGKMANQGFELSLGATRIKLGNVSWRTDLNFSYNTNKVLALAPGQTQIISGSAANLITRVGGPISELYGYQVIGVFKDQNQLNNTPTLPGTLLGDYIVKDVNGDNIIDQKDWTPMGSYFPKYNYGFTNNFSYKGFNLSFSLAAIQGRTVYAMQLATREESGEGFTLPNRYYYDNFYDPISNPNGTLASPNFGNYSAARRSTRASDVNYKNGDYIRLRDAQLGYTFSSNHIKKLGMASAKIYLSGNNLFTLSQFKGFNPDGTGSNILNSSENRHSYPVARSYMIGCNITF